jgi:hypothetical protein
MKRPQGRTLKEFSPLSAAEKVLLTSCERGDFAMIGSACPESAQPENTVRADFVAFLAMGGDDNAPVHHRGVCLQGAWIDGELSLSSASLPFDISLNRCRWAGAGLNLRDAEINGSLFLSGSQTQGLTLDGAVVKGDVFLNDGFKASGEVRMLGVQVGGDLDCSGAQLDGQSGDALSLDRAMVKGGVFLSDGFKASGEVRMLGAQVGGNLECNGAQLDGQGGDAISLDRVVVKGSVFLNGSFKARGKVRMLGAKVDGELSCSSAQLDGKGGDALVLDGLVVKGSVFLNDRFKASGKVRMLGAHVGGILDCSGAQLDGQGGHALALDRAVINGSVFLKDSFKASGAVRMLGAQVGGNLSCSGALLDNGKEGTSLSMEGAKIVGTWFVRQSKAPLMGVQLAGCRVERLVDEAASWAGNLRLDGFVYTQLAGDSPVSASDRIDWLRKQTPRALGNKNDNVGFKPQPWLQLQKVLREMGHLEDARQVAIALEDLGRAIGLVGQTPDAWGPWRRMVYGKTSVFLHWAFKILIGYGYRPLRLVGWMISVWIFSAAVFWVAALQGAMGPTNPLVFNDPELRMACANNWYLCEKLPEEYTGFSPLAYSLDVLLPLVNLEQEKDWAPLIPTPKPSWWKEWLANWSFKHFARLVVWAEILFGWIASLLLVAVFSGLAKRREE